MYILEYSINIKILLVINLVQCTTDTEENAPNPLRKDGGKEPGISAKSSQNQSSKVEKKTKRLRHKRKLLTYYAKTGHGIWDLNKISAKAI